MKKWDYIIIVFALLCLGGSFIVSALVLTQTGGVPTVMIYSDKKLVYEKELTSDLNDTIDVKTEWGYNIVDIVNGDVFIKEADCPDQTCVKDWHIHQAGQMIFCLPHRLIIEIKGVSTIGVDDVSQ